MMSNAIHQSFRINLLVMKIFHLYPPDKPSCLYRVRACVIYFLFIVPVPLFSILYLLLEKNLNMERVNYNGGFLAQTTGFIFKFLPFIVNDRRIKKCINYFEATYFKGLKLEDKVIIDKCIRVCRRNTIAFFVSAVIAVFSWATKPFFWEGRNYPVDVWLPFNSTENSFCFWCIYIFIASGPIVASVSTGVIDPLIAGLAYHATSQLKILKNNLQRLDECSVQSTKQISSKLSTKPKLYERIRKCVIHHYAVSRFVKEYENCFSWVVFCQIAASIFVVCFLCLHLSKIEPSGFYFVQMVAYFTVILAEIYFYCYYGSILSEESESLAATIYMGNWYNYDIRSRKALLILMKRSQKPLTVTVGKIVDLSLETFTVILRRSYSLLAFLKNYQ